MGKVFKYGDHVDTDVIIPARFLNVSEPSVLARHCMADLDISFHDAVAEGDVMVAGDNFGCGSSREHAPIAIKASGIQCVIAKSFARIFFRNAFNIGLPLIESELIASECRPDDQVKVDFVRGVVENLTQNKSYTIEPLPAFMQSIINAGGLVAYTKEVQNV